MSEPIIYPSRTDALGLPLLFAGQAQKEFFINEAMFLVDAVIWRTVEAALDTPPADAPEGACYRILDGALADWSGRDHSIAIRIGAGWHFISPSKGMLVFDRMRQCWYHFNGIWSCANEVTSPEGGTVIDVEARAALSQLIDALKRLGILSVEAS